MPAAGAWTRKLGDAGYAVKHAASRLVCSVFGPPHLGVHDDPLKRLERERAERRERRREEERGQQA